MSAPAGYRILDEIGRGGMGVVYRALQVELKREVALKCLLPELSHEPEVLARLRREAAAMSRVAHAGLVKLLDVGEHDGQPYIAMEIVPGASLAQLLKTMPTHVAARADELVAGVLEALAELHGIGLTHRDLKPSNVMVRPDGQPVLMDLGLVKDLSKEGTLLTAAGQMVGTPAYIAPEVLNGKPASPRADLWAIGCMYYEMVTGQRLFRSEALVVMIGAILGGDLPDLARACPALPPSRLAFLSRLLSVEAARRPADARAALAECRAAGRAASADSTRTPLKQALPPPRSSRGLVAGALAGALALGVLVARRAPDAPAWIETASPAAPSASAAPVASVPPAHEKRLLSKGWDEQYDYYAKLLSLGGKPAERALRDIVQRAGVPFAVQTPEVGQRWLDLGRWIKTGANPAKLPPTLTGGSSTRLAQQVLWSTGGLFTPEQLAVILITQEPAEARGWLALGFVLGQEGDHAAAQRVYDYALERPIGEVSETEWPRYLAAALVRSAMRRPGLLEDKWPGWVARSDLERTGWEGLLEAFDTSQAERVQALFEAGERTNPTEALYQAWATHAKYVGPLGGQRAVLKRGLARLPAAQGLPSWILDEAGGRGEPAEARGDVPQLLWDSRVTPIEPYLDVDGPRRGQAQLMHVGSNTMRAALDQLIAERGVGVVPELVAHVSRLPEPDDRVGRWALESIGLGFEHPALTALADRAIKRGLPHLTWELEGSLATDAGAPWMERLLADPGALGHIAIDARRALWLARRGKFDEALDLFDRARATAGTGWPTENMIEVVTRPIWIAAIGQAVAPEAVTRARALATRFAGGQPDRLTRRAGLAFSNQRAYVAAVAADRFAEAGTLAADLFARTPEVSLWQESVAWAAHLAGDRQAFARAVARAHRACIYTSASRWHVRRLRGLER